MRTAIFAILLLTTSVHAQNDDAPEPLVIPSLPQIPTMPGQTSLSLPYRLPELEAVARLGPLFDPLLSVIPPAATPELLKLVEAWRDDQHAFYEQSEANLEAFFESRQSWQKGEQPTLDSGYKLSQDDVAYLAATDAEINRVVKHRAEVRAALRKFHDKILSESRPCRPGAFVCMDDIDVSKVPPSQELRVLLSMRFAAVGAPYDPGDRQLTAKIIAVEVDDKAYGARVIQAKIALDNASSDYNAVRDAEERVRVRFQKALRDHQKETAPLIKSRGETLREIAALQGFQFKPTSPLAKLKNTPHYRNLQAARLRQQAVIDRLTARKQQVREFGGSKSSIQLVLSEVQSAIDNANARLDTLDREHIELVETANKSKVSPPAFSSEINALQIKLEGIDRQIRRANIALEVVSETLAQAFEKLEAADQKLADAMQALDLLKGKGSKLLLSIETNEIFEAQFTNKRAELKDLNRAISLSRQAVFDARYQREKFRQLMLSTNEEASNASENLQTAIMASASGQLAIEALLQVKDGLDAAKGGPGVFVLWAANQTATNVFNPPKIYEPEYRLDGAQSTIVQIAEGYIAKGKQEALDRAAKYGRGKTYDHLKSIASDTLKLGHIEKEMQAIMAQTRKATEGDYLNTKTLAVLRTRYKSQEAVYGSAADALSINIGAKGKAKFAAKVSTGLLISLVKSLAVEAVKREIADFFEGDAGRAYMRANNRFVTAVRSFRVAGNIYWRNRDTLEGLLALRQEIKAKYYDEESSLLIDHSDAFELKEEVRFWLNFADEDGEPSTQPHPGNVKVFLNSVQLHRYPNSDIFDLLRSDAEQLREAGHKDLTMKIFFE